jgi:hypothetical protein
MPLTPRLESKTLKLAMEGRIFDEGKGLLPNTLKKCFPSPATGSRAVALLAPQRGRYSTNGEGAGRGGKRQGRLSFRLA